MASQEPHLSNQLKRDARVRFPGLVCRCQSEWGKCGLYLDFSYTDGPSEPIMETFLSTWKQQEYGSLFIIQHRQYSFNFFSSVIKEYCRCCNIPQPQIYIDALYQPFVQDIYVGSIDLAREVHSWLRQLSSNELDTFILHYNLSYQRVERSSLLTKKDYSNGLLPGKAIVGDYGYGRLSGSYTRFSIVPVLARKGPHLVQYSSLDEQDTYYYGLLKAKDALNRFIRNGTFHPEWVNGTWQ